MEKYDVIIIGAGAAGLMCAIEAGKRGRKTLILEKADKVAKKILISGGGRCNFTNLYTSPDDFLSNNPHFCKSALSRYTTWDFIALVEKYKLSWTEKSLGQLFCDQKAGAIVNILTQECQTANVEIQLKESILSVSKKDVLFTLKTDHTNYQTKSLIIATGGPSIPAMGATDFALSIAQLFSLKTIPFEPALVPFTFEQEELNNFYKDLSGISADVEICTKDGKCFKESILFTHRGISGPAVLQASSYWNLGEEISINFFPDEDIASWLKTQQQEHSQAELKTVLAYKIAKRLANKFCDKNGIINNKVMKTYSEKDIDEIASQLNSWQVTPNGTEGLRTAEVCLGGIDTDELSSKTFEVKSVNGLYFIGESVDVTGHLGGFNFQWAWASGWCAGQVV
ncbi:MAG: NAD(P)/FAD-dependent oxidoreductase [Cocleimonas sp.]